VFVMKASYQVSERRACTALDLARSTIRHKSVADPQTALRMRLKDLAMARIGYGYRRLHILIEREGWHEMIGDPTLADAILDRLVHNAHKIELKGESVRKTLKSLTQSGHQVHNLCPASLRSDTRPPSLGMGGRNRLNTHPPPCCDRCAIAH